MEIGPETFTNGIILIVLLFLAGLLFLLFRKFTGLLRKYEKITLKTKRVINWGFVIFVGVGVFSFYRHLIFRTPGTVFIEKVTHIKTPEGTIVLKDQLQNSFQDHSIECNLQFDQKGNLAYIQAIKRSPDFDPKRFESKDLEYTDHSKNGTWCRTENGYRFNRFHGNEVESIYFDTSARTLYYEGGSF